ncbi:MAG: hypothetical protein HDR88_01805 [Bacteroides sp.]|nr:hypothetical protein [Bacteroides sp.]
MKIENKEFVDWYNSKPGFERRYAANLIMIGCNISRPTFLRWVTGDVEIKNPYRMVINQIAGKELFKTVAFTSMPN